jgi:hypothetical protein
MPAPSRHVELALYADDTVLIATSRSPLLFVRYLETYLNRLELAIGLEDSYQHLEEHCSAIFQDHEMRSKTQAIPAFRIANAMGRNSTVPWGKP